jgi:hypothetical protein
MDRPIVGFHQDAEGHWVAQLACGHNQHVRHEPPWMSRPWVLTPEGRSSRLGVLLNCTKCDRGEPPDRPGPGGAESGMGDGGNGPGPAHESRRPR